MRFVVIYLHILIQVVENNGFLGGFLLLSADSQFKAHNELAHQASLEGVPQEFRNVACDCLKQRIFMIFVINVKKKK